jgi:hypothetical protein
MFRQPGRRITAAVRHITGTKMKCQAAGKMGHSTSQIGDLVCDAVVAKA